MTPSLAELVDFFLKIEDDPKRRATLNSMPYEIFKAAVEAELFERLDQSAFAQLVGKAVQQGLIGFERTHAAVPSPGHVWSDSDFQMRSGYYVTTEGRQMVDLFRRQRANDMPGRASARNKAEDPARVMVVHGRDSGARDDLFELLKALGLKPIGWTEAVTATGVASPYNAEAVNAAFGIAQAAVVLFTPDERVRLRRDLRDSSDSDEAEWRWQPRPNVFYEGGIAFSSHPQQTVIVEHGRPTVPSDLAGRNAVRTDNADWRRDLGERLRSAGCPVQMNGTEWLAAGDFEPPRLDDADEGAMPVAFQDPISTALPREW
jgi:predicted nucleotide-binding protein